MSDTNPKHTPMTDAEFERECSNDYAPEDWAGVAYQEAKRARRSEAALKARCEALEKAADFAAYTRDFGGRQFCRFCDTYKGEPHFSECRFAALLSPRDGEAK